MFLVNITKIKLTLKHIIKSKLRHSIRYYTKLESTNTKAWELVSRNISNGTAIYTDNQTAGRGRNQNVWFSTPHKSLTFSVILYPNCLPEKINVYSLIAGLAIADTLKKDQFIAKLKWPNDVLINGKKVAGILCESKLQVGKIKAVVIGIGLNVNNEISNFPESIQAKTTSLFIENGIEHNLNELLKDILNSLDNRLNYIDNTESIIQDWENSCAHLNQEVQFKNGKKSIYGKFIGLSKTGRALIAIDNKICEFSSGEILNN